MFLDPHQCDATEDCPSVGPYTYLIHAVDGLACFCAMHAATVGLSDTYVRRGYYGVDVLLRTRPVPDAARTCALYFPCPEADACRLSCTEGCKGARPAQLGDANVVNFAGLVELLTYPDTDSE
jgi:hypothetical protein